MRFTLPILCVLLFISLLVELAILLWWPKEKPVYDIQLPEIVFDQADVQNRQRLQMMYQRAVQVYQETASLNELAKTADILLCYGYHLQAAQLYQSILHYDPQQGRSWQGLAMALDSLSHFDSAVQAYTEVLSLPSLASVHAMTRHRIAEISLIHEKKNEAKKLFSENKNYPPSHYRYIRLLLLDKEWVLAEQEFAVLNTVAQAKEAMELVQLNDMYQRMHGKQFAPLIDHNRDMLWSFLPIDVFQRSIERYYNLGMMDLFTPALMDLSRSAPQQVPFNHSLIELRAKPEILQRGEALFQSKNCIVCHGQDALGVNAPNLRDDYWLSDGTPQGIYDTIRYGRARGTMPAHQFSLHANEIRDLTVYLLDLNLKTAKQAGKTASGKDPEGELRPLSRFLKN